MGECKYPVCLRVCHKIQIKNSLIVSDNGPTQKKVHALTPIVIFLCHGDPSLNPSFGSLKSLV